MWLVSTMGSRHSSRRAAALPGAFTLVEMLLVVVLIGILASLVIPRLNSVQADSAATALERQLQIVRSQIELFRSRHGGADPDLTTWDDLVDGGYLQAPPENPLNHSTAINGEGDFSGGWIWRDDGTGEKQIYATDTVHGAEMPY